MKCPKCGNEESNIIIYEDLVNAYRILSCCKCGKEWSEGERNLVSWL